MKKIILIITMLLTTFIMAYTVNGFYTSKVIIIANDIKHRRDFDNPDIDNLPETIGKGGWNIYPEYNDRNKLYSRMGVTITNIPKSTEKFNFKLGMLPDISGQRVIWAWGINAIQYVNGVPDYTFHGYDGTNTGFYLTIVDDSIYKDLQDGSLNIENVSQELVSYDYVLFDDIFESNYTSYGNWFDDDTIEFEIDMTQSLFYDIEISPNQRIYELDIRINIIEGITREQLFIPYRPFSPYSRFDMFLRGTEISLTVESLKFNFYNGTSLYSTILVAKDTYMTLPQNPTPPLDKLSFAGWRTKTGEIIDNLDNITLKSEWIDNGEINLFARYLTKDGEAYVSGQAELNAPDFLVNIMDKIGIDNPFGRYLLYFVIIIIFTIGLLSIKANTFVFMIVYLGITLIWGYLGFMPLFATIIIFLLEILMTLFIIKGGTKSDE